MPRRYHLGHLLRATASTWLVFVLAAATPTPASEPEPPPPTLLVEWGGEWLPVERFALPEEYPKVDEPLKASAFPPALPVVHDKNGVERIVPDVRLKLSEKARAALSPLDGWSPSAYGLHRREPDHHRASRGRPLHLYRVDLELYVTHPPPKEVWQTEYVAPLWGLEPPKGHDGPHPAQGIIWLLAWWDPTTKTWRPEVDTPRKGNRENLRFGPERSEERIHLRPVILAFQGRTFLPMPALSGTPWHHAFNRLRSGTPPTPEDLALMTEKGPFDATLLEFAASWGDLAWVEGWAEARTTMRRPPKADPEPLFRAARHNRASLIAPLIAGKIPLDAVDSSGFTAAHTAAHHGFPAVMEALFAQGYRADSVRKRDTYPPISLAADGHHDDIFGLLVDRQAELHDFNESVRDELLAFHTSRGNARIAQHLLGLKADPNAIVNSHPVLRHAVNGGNPEVVRLLLEAKADPNRPDAGVLHRAIQLNQLKITQLLLGGGARLDLATARSPHPLILAVLHDNAEMAALLVAAGADPNAAMPAPSPIGLIEIATIAGRPDMVRHLFDLGTQCRFPPELAEDLLILAISDDIPEVATLAFESCVQEDFSFYGLYDLEWVIDYYAAEQSKAWAQTVPNLPTRRPPAITPNDLCETPAVRLDGRVPAYSKELFDEFGPLRVEVQILVEPDGQARFPLYRGDSLPPPLAIPLHDAIKAWRFDPARREGHPVRTLETVSLEFTFEAPEAQTFTLEEVSQPPKVLEQPPPYYPAVLRRARQSGKVDVAFVVGSNGRTTDIQVLRSTHPLFGNAAIASIRDWVFEPAEKDGKPVPCRIQISIPFQTR